MWRRDGTVSSRFSQIRIPHDAPHLFHQASLLELVAIRQATYQLPLPGLVERFARLSVARTS